MLSRQLAKQGKSISFSIVVCQFHEYRRTWLAVCEVPAGADSRFATIAWSGPMRLSAAAEALESDSNIMVKCLVYSPHLQDASEPFFHSTNEQKAPRGGI